MTDGAIAQRFSSIENALYPAYPKAISQRARVRVVRTRARMLHLRALSSVFQIRIHVGIRLDRSQIYKVSTKFFSVFTYHPL